MLTNLPLELRRLPQWVVVGPNKAPLNPRTFRLADVTDPSTWGSFDEAVQSGRAVGFVLCEGDPFTFIDLDAPKTQEQADRHQRIFEAFDTYTELSQSGNGVHIVCRGRVPRGVRRDAVEVYSAERYMICTGSVLKQRPITDQQRLLDVLFAEMDDGRASVGLVETGAVLSDEALWEMAAGAVNGEKFRALWDGQWAELGYPSQSEADYALLAMLAFYSKSNEQVRRVFRMSQLGKRDKAQRDAYLDRALRHMRAKEPPPVDVDALLADVYSNDPQSPEEAAAQYDEAEAVLAAAKAPPPKPARQQAITFPPGVVGEVAQYILDSAIRPVPEIALCAAIALCAGIAGRSYNISGTGLNQYLIALAPTGSGKEGAAAGIDTLISAVRRTVPAADIFIGPATFASGQAMIRQLDRSPCFVSVLGEFGLTLQQVCDPRANGAERALKKVWLDLYTKSGRDKVIRPSVYSDNAKDTKTVRAPCVTLFGESTATTFYDGLDSTHIAEGLVPRFLVVEYKGGRPARNPNANCEPPAELVTALTELVSVALTTQQNHTCAPVATDTEADEVLSAFDAEADRQINDAPGEVEKHLWNRAHLKALKLAALLAVGCDVHNPVITRELAEWAVGFVRRDVTNLEAKFGAGETGQGEHRQESDVRRCFADYQRMTEKQRAGYGVPEKLCKESNALPYCVLRRRLRPLASFRNDRRGASEALRRTLDDMVHAGVLALVPAADAVARWDSSAPVYLRGRAW
jgi:hypothetical protein